MLYFVPANNLAKLKKARRSRMRKAETERKGEKETREEEAHPLSFILAVAPTRNHEPISERQETRCH